MQPHRIGEGPVETIAATKLHAYLGVATEYPLWIDRRVEEYGFREGIDFVRDSFPSNLKEKGKRGRPPKDWLFTLDMAKERAMVERKEKGCEARRYWDGTHCGRSARHGSKCHAFRRRRAARQDHGVSGALEGYH
ncbi:antA/AntB antirepressor family protein [Roseomonas sp. CAU 1739]|uniref:antA/AntB antirepressor family protein n=1 Tax=Roseomonas sp. CAU 1739 TaxID=3140364 RepID=UPI00325ADD2A